MSINHIISEICNSWIWEVILIGDNIILLDYEQQFMGSLHVVDSRSRTWASSCCYLLRVLECSWFFLIECWINFKIGLWGSQYSYGPQWSLLWALYHDDMVYEGWIYSRFILMHKSILIITQGCTWDNEQGL